MSRARVEADLHEARADLLAALAGATDADLLRHPGGPGAEAWSVREVIWHVGVEEDLARRRLGAARRGVTIERERARRVPAHLVTVALLREWLLQTRRPLEVMLARVPDEAFDAPLPGAPGGAHTWAEALAAIAAHDREHAAQVRALLSGSG